MLALHLARQAMAAGECSGALAAGTQIMLQASTFHLLTGLGALSPDGRCKTFSSAADGYGRRALLGCPPPPLAPPLAAAGSG